MLSLRPCLIDLGTSFCSESVKRCTTAVVAALVRAKRRLYMPEPRSTVELLRIALDDHAEATCTDHEQQVISMIRSIIATIQGDVLDGVPSRVRARATDLVASLPKAPAWFDRAAATLLRPLFDDRPRLVAGLRGHDLRQCTYSTGDLRLDLEVESPSTTDSLADDSRIRGQLDAEQPLVAPIPVAVFVADTDRLVTSTTTAADGRFDLMLPPGIFDFAFKLDDVTQLIGRLALP